MAKTTVNPGQAAFIQAQKELASQGVEHGQIDKLLSKSAVEEVMRDVPALRNYFGVALKGLYNITQWDYDFVSSKAISGSVQSPDHFKEFYTNDVSKPVPLRDFVPLKYFENTQLLVDDKIFNQEQANALQMLLHGEGQPSAPGDDAEDSPSSQPGYGGGGSKNYGTGYGSGSAGNVGVGKAYGTAGGGKAYETKSLGGGGPPGPPPMPPGAGYGGPTGGGYGGGYGSDYGTPTTPNMDRERDYISSLNHDPNYGLLQMVFTTDYDSRGFSASILSELQRIRAAESQINDLMAHIDPKDPNGAAKLRDLSFRLQQSGTSERELMDRLGTAQRAKDEMITLVKAMMDTNFKTMQTIISNYK